MMERRNRRINAPLWETKLHTKRGVAMERNEMSTSPAVSTHTTAIPDVGKRSETS